MKTLYLLRHAKSSWKDIQISDHDRPLNSRGKRDAPRMGKLMKSLSLNPDLILSSTAVRARKTAELVSKASQLECPVELREELYHASVIDYYDILHTLYYDENSLMIIGHNPGMEDFLYSMTAQTDPMKTATLAEIAIPVATWKDFLQETPGILKNIWYPKDIDN